MEIFIPSETLKAIVKAGCKAEVFSGEDAGWRGIEVDSKLLTPDDFKIIKEVVKRPANWVKEENRRIFRRLETVESLDAAGPEGPKVKRLEVLAEAIKKIISPTPNKWVFRADEVLGTLLPLFVEDVEYTSASAHSKARVHISLRANCRGGKVEQGISFQRDDLLGGGKTAVELLEGRDIYIETPKLVADYEKEMAMYLKYAPQTGEQFLGTGKASLSSESRWHRGSINLETDGAPAKMVMDDMEEQGKESGFLNTDFWNDKSTGKKGDEEENELTHKLPVHPIVRAFNLGTHDFLDCHVTSLVPYKYDASLINKLVLPPEHKELVDALTGSAIRKMDDIIVGKAVGTIILCSGAPGTGKTLTAEVYSESAKRPLYMVHCSQLGTDEEKLEKNLAEVLSQATRWRAILLIDEADVYIHERGANIQQNAIVGVFLRLLEYYRGILFMTTNRATIVDDAIISRVTAHVRYDIPTDGEYERLWKVLMEQYGVLGDVPVREAVKAWPRISGRDIRQLIRLAKIMSDEKKTKFSIAALKQAAKFHDFTSEERGTTVHLYPAKLEGDVK